MERATVTVHPSLLQLVSATRWLKLQEQFAKVLGIPMRTVSPSGTLLLKPSWPASLLNDQAIALLKAGEELEALIPAGQPPQECTSITTALGATYAAAPVRLSDGAVLAYFVVGPVVVGLREDELAFRQRLQALGIESAALWPLVLSLKLYSFAGIRAVLGLLEEVGTALVRTAQEAREFTAAAAFSGNGHGPQGAGIDDRQRVVEMLLDAAVSATGADGGSVMLLDAHAGTLHIQAARGLQDTIVAHAQVRVGEGLAGLALAERSPLLVDERTPDARVRSRMVRRDLVSSIVAPIMDATLGPLGVLNLRSTTAGKRFSTDHVEVLRRLTDLAVAALRPSLGRAGVSSPA